MVGRSRGGKRKKSVRVGISLALESLLWTEGDKSPTVTVGTDGARPAIHSARRVINLQPSGPDGQIVLARSAKGRQSPAPPEINVFGVWFRFGSMVDPADNYLVDMPHVGAWVRTRTHWRSSSPSEGGAAFENTVHGHSNPCDVPRVFKKAPTVEPLHRKRANRERSPTDNCTRATCGEFRDYYIGGGPHRTRQRFPTPGWAFRHHSRRGARTAVRMLDTFRSVG